MKYVKLKPNSKIPATPHGHHDATDIKPEGNYGIVLDGDYVAFDFDEYHIERRAIESTLPWTWAQRTPRPNGIGSHYLYTLPKGYIGKNTTLKASDGTRIGDIKFNGYIVGPGSEIDGRFYTQFQDIEPIPIPLTLLEGLLGPAKALKADSKDLGAFDVMPDGNRDNSLHKIGSALRGVGFTEKGIALNLAAIVNSGTIEQPEGREIEKKDIERLAHSCAGYKTNLETPFTVKILRSAYDLPKKQPDIEWVMFRFIPQHKLTFQYGSGGIGKSTWVPWLVRKLLLEGKKVGFSATEETFEHFSNGVRLGMENFDIELFRNLYDLENTWTFPKDTQHLVEILEQCPLDFIYFDSLYDIFDSKGQGLFANTRPSLTPLSRIAQEMKVTILGTFHENKSGTFNGSKEMESIPRALLHATSEHNRLRLHVAKSNNKKPDNDILFYGDWVPEMNLDGSIIKEKNKEGTWVDNEIFIVRGYDEVEIGEDEEKQKEEVTVKETISLTDLETNTSNDEAYWKVYNCLNDNPTWGRILISRELGLSEKIVQNRLDRIK
jgi:bifunctional DNA primase/polymerase-like protein/AAA domain-containing protein